MWRLAYYFFILGCIYGGWAGRLPEIQAAVGASDLSLGIALFSSSIGALSAIFISPRIIRLLSSKHTVTLATLGYATVVATFGFVISTPQLCTVLFISGAISATLDVAINIQAVRFENLRNVKCISRLHAIFSMGLVAGGIVGASLSWLPLSYHLILSSTVVVVGALLLRGGLLEDEAASEGSSEKESKKVWSFSPQTKLLAFVLFVAALCEGAIVEWSAKYLKQELLVAPWSAPLGVSAFSVGMVLGRTSGDWWRGKLHFSTLLIAGTAITAFGVSILCVTSVPEVALFAAAVCGVGLSILVPIAYAAAGDGKQGRRTEDALAQLTAVAYSALLLGPALIGGLSEYLGLRGAFGLLPLLLLCATWAGWRMKRLLDCSE